MSAISRATLPQNFLDSVNAGLRLPTPEPQYLFATLAMAGRLNATALSVGATSVTNMVLESANGAQLPPDLDRLARVADGLPDAVQAVDQFGLGQGDTIKLWRDIYDGGGYTEAARKVVPNSPTSTTGQSVRAEEVPMVLEQFEGPYNTDASQVRPYAIPEFDAKYRANKEALVSKTGRHLTRDYMKWLDTVIRDRFRSTANITYSDGVADVLSMTAGAGKLSNMEMLLEAKKALSDREWQPFSSGRMLAIVPTSFNTQMVSDPAYREMSKAHSADRNLIFGHIGSIQNLDIVECSTLKSYAAGETVPGDGNAVPAGATVFEGLLIGPGCVGMGTAQDAEAFYADDTDYGKVAKVIWRSIQAFQTLDTRGCQRFLFQAA